MTNSQLLNPLSTVNEADPEIVIRAFEPQDLTLVREMYLRLSHDSDKEESANRYLRFIFDRLFTTRVGRGWTAIVNGEAVGVAAALLEEHIFETPEVGIVGEFIYVKKKYRQFGVGERLVREIFDTLAQNGAERMKVQLQPQNEQFNKLFVELGFVKTATLYEWLPYEKRKTS